MKRASSCLLVCKYLLASKISQEEFLCTKKNRVTLFLSEGRGNEFNELPRRERRRIKPTLRDKRVENKI